MAEPKAERGRPTLLTPELQQKIVTGIRMGVYPEVSAGAHGVRRATFYEWLRRGQGLDPNRAQTPEYADFADAILQAIDQAEYRLVAKLAEFTEGRRPHKKIPKKLVKTEITMAQVTSAQWNLSRRFPERWGMRPGVPQPPLDAPGADPLLEVQAKQEVEKAGVRIEIVYGDDVGELETDDPDKHRAPRMPVGESDVEGEPDDTELEPA